MDNWTSAQSFHVHGLAASSGQWPAAVARRGQEWQEVDNGSGGGGWIDTKVDRYVECIRTRNFRFIAVSSLTDTATR